MTTITELRVNHQRNPIGIENPDRISWKLGSDSRNIYQEGYEMELSEKEDFSRVLFASGKITDTEFSMQISDSIRSVLKSAVKYYIRVRVYVSTGERTDWKQGFFVTAYLHKNEWKGRFITPEKEEDKDKSRGYYLRGFLFVKKKIKSAYAFVTGLGLYHFYLNGKKVGEDEFTPGWTSYRKHLLYQVYDVKDLLQEGANAAGAMIGAGWYKGDMGSARTRNHYGTRNAFAGQIEVCYTDGERECFTTGKDWKWKESPVVFSEIYDGEIYDARLEQKDWNTLSCSFADWNEVEELTVPTEILSAQSGCKVRVTERFPALKIIKTPQKDTVLDFGQNLAGWIEFKVEGRSGEKAELQCFETLDKDGNVYLENLRTAKARLTYICGENGEAVYHPNFTYQGFRYAKIVSYPGEPAAENFTACAVYSDMDMLGTFTCSNPDINQLHHNILWGMKSNFLDVPTDCPQRDERLGWTGDAQIFCRTASYLMDTDLFFRKWLRDVREEQTAEGGIPHVVPDVWTGKNVKGKIFEKGTDSAAAWGDAAVIVPWNLYLMYGDTEVIKEQYESMKAWIDFMRRHEKNGSWEYKMQFGDWVALDAEEGSYYGATPLPMTNLAYYVYSAGLFAEMAHVIGEEEDAASYRTLYSRLKNSYIEQYYTEDGHLTVQTQTAQIISLYFDLVPEEFRENVIGDLMELLRKEKGHLVTGFVGTPYFCQVLSDSGHVQEAYELLLKDDFPSWLYQVKMGATTVWEHWDGMRPDGTMWSPAMNSFNHYAYGAVGEWLYRTMAGIECAKDGAGFCKIILSPRIGKMLDYVSASYESIYGTIRSSWIRTEDSVALNFSIPCGTTAEIKLQEAVDITEPGGICFRKENGAEGIYSATVGSGTYEVIYRLI